MLHPNKINPLRYRVQVKALGINEYYSFAKYGVKKAKQLACERDAELKKQLTARRMQEDLAINKLFTPEGGVKGLRRKWSARTNRKSYECFSLYAKHKQTEIVLTEDNFEEAYKAAQIWLLDKHKLSSNYEIRQMFKKAKRLYWSSVKPT